MTSPDAGLVVRDVTVRTVVVPFRRPLATRVGYFAQWPLLLIDVRTEQGITGHGYLAPYLPTAASAIRAVLADLGQPAAWPAAPAAAAGDARGWFALAGYQGLAPNDLAACSRASTGVAGSVSGVPAPGAAPPGARPAGAGGASSHPAGTSPPPAVTARSPFLGGLSG